jgi:hypothetical protein
VHGAGRAWVHVGKRERIRTFFRAIDIRYKYNTSGRLRQPAAYSAADLSRIYLFSERRECLQSLGSLELYFGALANKEDVT